MTLFFHPSYSSQVYTDYTKHNNRILFDELCVSTAGLLEQLLLRAGIPQGIVEDSETRTKAREQAYLQFLTDDWIRPTCEVDSIGAVQQVLAWRDCLLMEGWNPDMTSDSSCRKLAALSRWEKEYQTALIPASADRWCQLYKHLLTHGTVLNDQDRIIVMTPKILLPKLVVQVLDLLKATYQMEQMDTTLLHPERIQVVKTVEQYETWQQVHNYVDTADVFVCADTERLNNTMYGIGGEYWQLDNAGTPKVIRTLTDMLDTPKHIVWLDCAGGKTATNRFAWLTHAEKTELANKGVNLATPEELSSASLHEQFTILNKIDKITLLVSKTHEGELLCEHPVVTTLNPQEKNIQHPTLLPQTSPAEVITFHPKEEYHLDEANIQKLDKGNISPTALDKMIQLPFDFLLEKMAHLPAPEDNEDENVSLAEGSVAHKVVELLMKQANKKLTEMKKLLESDYERLLNEAMDAQDRGGNIIGDILRDDEHSNELATFKMDLKESIQTLLHIISTLDLTPEESEHEFLFEDGLDAFKPAKGSIDMVLKDNHGNYVIFDFKYSKSSTYPDKLKFNHSTQLEFYRKALEKEGKTVAWTAYYLFPKQSLYTKANLNGMDNVCVVGDPRNMDQVLTDLWSAMQNGYKVRLYQLENGIVEEAEGFVAQDQAYSQADNVYPLAIEYKHKYEKAGGFCRYTTDDTNLLHKPTHHTILKNHLK